MVIGIAVFSMFSFARVAQTTDFHFANYIFSLRFFPFRFVSLHFVSQTTVSKQIKGDNNKKKMTTVAQFSQSHTTVKTCLFYLRYFFTVESALELIEKLNKELKSGLKAGGSTIHALLSTTTCKKKLYHQNFETTVQRLQQL